MVDFDEEGCLACRFDRLLISRFKRGNWCDKLRLIHCDYVVEFREIMSRDFTCGT